MTPVRTKPMRIAFIAGPLSHRAYGVKAVVERLSAALCRQGHDVRVFGLRDEAWERGDDRLWTGAPASVFATQGPGAFGYAPRLQDAVHDFSPDVLHTHGLWMYGSLASARLARSGIPNVISPHGMLDGWSLARGRLKKRAALSLYEGRHLTESRCLHALAASEVDAFRKAGLTGPTCVLPNGVDLPGPSTGQPAWRDALPVDARILLYLGRLHPKKNLRNLIAGWAGTNRQDWHLVIAGPDQESHAAELEQTVSVLKLSGSVHLIGAQHGTDKSATLEAADAFVLPSLSEGLPMAVLEAWSHGLPVLMSDACNLPLGFEMGAALHCGTTATEISEAISHLVTLTDSNRSAIGRAGRKLVGEFFCWDRIAVEFGDLYQWVSDDRHDTPPNSVTRCAPIDQARHRTVAT